jgi:translation initiation factor 1
MAADGIDRVRCGQAPLSEALRRAQRAEGERSSRRRANRGGQGAPGKALVKRKRDDSRLVYSSDGGRMLPRKEPAPPRRPPGDATVRVRREVKGRRGKTVTTIEGVPLTEGDLRDLASELKRRCGTGGSVKDGVIEIQGDHRDILVAELEGRGYTVKRAGG